MHESGPSRTTEEGLNTPVPVQEGSNPSQNYRPDISQELRPSASNGSGEFMPPTPPMQAPQPGFNSREHSEIPQNQGTAPFENQSLVSPDTQRGSTELTESSTPSKESKLTTLTAAVERAKAGGRPVSIAQIGDSHIAPGIETASLAKKFADNEGLNQSQVDYSYKGVVGKSASYAASHPGEFLSKINSNTDLVVVSFGSNEATKQVGNGYKNDYAQLIGQIKQRAPNASILMVGPTDGAYWNSRRQLAGLGSVVEAQKAVQSQTPNSAYLDVRQFAGSMNSMRSRGMLSSDNLHLTAAGYKIVGGSIADSVVANT
jgi:lysophospholipase L1-like esterase